MKELFRNLWTSILVIALLLGGVVTLLYFGVLAWAAWTGQL